MKIFSDRLVVFKAYRVSVDIQSTDDERIFSSLLAAAKKHGSPQVQLLADDLYAHTVAERG